MDGLGTTLSAGAKRWLASLAVLILGLGLTGLIETIAIRVQEDDGLEQAQLAALDAAYQLEILAVPPATVAAALQANVGAAGGALDPTPTQQFLDDMVEGADVVLSATLAPDNVIEYISPVAGNEAALGLDLESIPAQWDPIVPLIESGRPGMLGPFDLVQGGRGLAYRQPVYLADGSYWGLASVVLDADLFFGLAEMNAELASSDVAITSGTPAVEAVIWGNPEILSGESVTVPLEVPGADWQLSVRASDQSAPWAIAIGLVGTVGSVLAAVIAYWGIGSRQRRLEVARRLEDLAALVPGMLFQYRIDPDNTTTLPYVSERLAKTFDINPEAVAVNAIDLWDLVDDADREAAATRMNQAIQSGTLWQQRFRLHEASGAVRWYEARAEPEYLRSGSVILHGYLADVSEDVEAEERMSIHASVYAATQNGVLILSESGHILDANPAFSDLTGYSLSSLHGHHLRFLGSDLTPDDVYREIRASLKRSEYWRGEFTLRDAHGAPKDYSMTVLQVRGDDTSIAHIIVIITPISELRNDLATGLPGRLTFSPQLDFMVDQAAHHQDSVLVVLIGLDRFSDINSALGYRVGDLVLREVAERFVSAVPDSATVARVGGDEFALALPLPNHSPDVAATVSGLESVLGPPINLASDDVRLSASIGFATFPQDSTNGSGLLSAATEAMRSAKSAGGGRIRAYDPSMRASAEQRARVATALTRALDGGTLEVKFQPIHDLTSGRIVKAEALARLTDPEYGTVKPDEFIPLAERMGRITEIGDIAFRKAAAMAVAAREYQPNFRIGVNLSPSELHGGPELHEKRLALLRDLSLDGSAIALEITEEAALGTDEDAINNLRRYRDAGMVIAVDDFGTGYSSLSYLQRLPLDTLKIDRSFISQLHANNESHTLVMVMVEMASNLGLRTIAEGIETEEQADLLQSAGCTMGQGYYFAPPMTAEELLELLREQAARG